MRESIDDDDEQENGNEHEHDHEHRRHHRGPHRGHWQARTAPVEDDAWEYGGDEGPQDWRPPRAQARIKRGPGQGFPMPPGPPFPFGPRMRGRSFQIPAEHVPGMHGPGMWPGPHRVRGGRAKRGDVRAAALALLAEGPLNGYQIIQEIGERSGGLWRPSPGSVYPALAQLEDENLITAQAGDGGRRAYVLTDDGRSYAAEHADELRAPWSDLGGDAINSAVRMKKLTGQVQMAAFQVMSAGTDAQVSQATQILTQARKSLYRLLAEDDEPDAGADHA